MPVEVAVDTEQDLVTITLTEVVRVEELLRSIRRALADPGFHPGARCLVDMREATHTSGGDVARRVAQLLIANRDKVAGARIAIVVSKAAAYGIIRMLQLQTQGFPFEIGVSYDLEEARRWLSSG